MSSNITSSDASHAVTSRRGGVSSIRHALTAAWRPLPLAEPVVPPDLPEMPFIERSSEVIKFQLLRLEYALSSGGGLRAWFKLNLLICLILAAPAVLVVPFVTAIVAGIATWSGYLLQTVQNFLFTLISLIAIGVILATLIYGVGQRRLRAAQRIRLGHAKP